VIPADEAPVWWDWLASHAMREGFFCSIPIRPHPCSPWKSRTPAQNTYLHGWTNTIDDATMSLRMKPTERRVDQPEGMI
jgi:hypothetical protein